MWCVFLSLCMCLAAATWSSAGDPWATFGEYAAGWCSFPLLPQEASEFKNNLLLPWYYCLYFCLMKTEVALFLLKFGTVISVCGHVFPFSLLLQPLVLHLYFTTAKEHDLWNAVVCSYSALEMICITFISLGDYFCTNFYVKKMFLYLQSRGWVLGRKDLKEGVS